MKVDRVFGAELERVYEAKLASGESHSAAQSEIQQQLTAYVRSHGLNNRSRADIEGAFNIAASKNKSDTVLAGKDQAIVVQRQVSYKVNLEGVVDTTLHLLGENNPNIIALAEAAKLIGLPNTWKREQQILMRNSELRWFRDVSTSSTAANSRIKANPGKDYLQGDLTDKQFDQISAYFDSTESRGQLNEIRREINNKGEEPQNGVLHLLKHNRIVAFGEEHEAEPQRDFGAKMIAKLKEAGATHLAIEVPATSQSVLDDYIKTGQLDVDKLPPLLRGKDYINILAEARKAKLKIIAVDGDQQYPNREPEMFKNISEILDESPNNKVIFWVGSIHLLKRPSYTGEYPDTGDLLRSKYNLVSIVSGDPDPSNPLYALTKDVKRPALVSTAKTSQLHSLQLRSRPDSKDEVYGGYDYVMVYPGKNH